MTSAPEASGGASKLLASLNARGFDARVTADAGDACNVIMTMLPRGGLISHGSSETLVEIGLVDRIVASHDIRYGNLEWLAETDPGERLEIRKRNSIFADVFLGGLQAIARTGEVVGCDAGGSRQGPYVWGPAKVIWVAGLNKVVDTLEDAIRRVYEVALPIEDARRRRVTPGVGSSVNKLVIYQREPIAHRTSLILVPGHFGH